MSVVDGRKVSGVYTYCGAPPLPLYAHTHTHTQLPSPLAALYNAVLDHAAHKATHPTLRNLSWPVVDFSPSEFTQGGKAMTTGHRG